MYDNLLLEIRRRKLRQYEVAGLAKISETTLSLILRGRVRPSPKVKQRIAQALGISVEKLFNADVKDAMPPNDQSKCC
ncbi:helix-turn-helix transcriptional regulator [candidate division KSB1 bacterium]|nr:helix-turn-helix transcriptional regulator [candidate division KSB1 bacterium]